MAAASPDAALAAAAPAARAAMDELNGPVSDAWHEEQRIEAEIRTLVARVAELERRAKSWRQLYGDLRTALLELGDAENFASLIADESRAVARAVGHASRVQRV